MDSTVNCDVTLRAEKRVKRERLGTRLDERLIWRKKSGYVWTGLPWSWRFFLKFFSAWERTSRAKKSPRQQPYHEGVIRGARFPCLPTWKTSSPKNACVRGYPTGGGDTTQIWIVLLIGLSNLLSATQIWLVKGNRHGISCARRSDVDLRGNSRWRLEMSAVFSGRGENESEAKKS